MPPPDTQQRPAANDGAPGGPGQDLATSVDQTDDGSGDAAGSVVTANGAEVRSTIIRNGERWPVGCTSCGMRILEVVVWRPSILGTHDGPYCEGCYSGVTQAMAQEASRRFTEMFGKEPRDPEPDPMPYVKLCTWCGGPVAIRSYRLPFCSTGCRYARELSRRRRERTDRGCETCGQLFTPPRSDGRYCSSACRQKAYRTRQAMARGWSV